MNSTTEAQAAIDENIAKGFMEIAGVGPDGEVQYRLTKAGEEHVERMIQAQQS
jgi:hypothetical protein